MQLYADLHTHTTSSDGILSPSELCVKAKTEGVSVLSITDHDSVSAYEELHENDADLFLIHGIEATTQYLGKECHLLLYGSEVLSSTVRNVMLNTKELRKNRALDIIDYLAEQGIEISFNEVHAEADFGIIGRPHFARLLIKKGWVSSMNEAFFRYLSDKHVGSLMPAYPSLEEVLQITKNSNIVAALAHPGTRFSLQELEKFKEHGLRGIEVLHPSHSLHIQAYLEDLALRLGLIITGGSDYHGTKPSCTENFGKFGLSKDQFLAFKSEYS